MYCSNCGYMREVYMRRDYDYSKKADNLKN